MSFYPCGLARGKLEGNKEVSELADAQAGDELFGLPPEEFVAARDDLARSWRPLAAGFAAQVRAAAGVPAG